MVYGIGVSLHTQSMWYKISGFLQVRVFTFAVGPPAESTEALHNMACSNRGEPNLNEASEMVNWYQKQNLHIEIKR